MEYCLYHVQNDKIQGTTKPQHQETNYQSTKPLFVTLRRPAF